MRMGGLDPWQAGPPKADPSQASTANFAAAILHTEASKAMCFGIASRKIWGGFRSSFAGVLRELSTAFAHSFAAALELNVLDVWP